VTGRSFPRGAGFDFAGTVAEAAAVQVARALGGRVTALASAPHLDRLRDLGAEQALDYRNADLNGLGRFDVIVDPVARNMLPYRRLLAPGGRMAAMAIGALGDIAYLLASRIHGFGKRVIQIT
jgi:NADPH:quinone reductase-like Zn-dependent oxidoreductase